VHDGRIDIARERGRSLGYGMHALGHQKVTKRFVPFCRGANGRLIELGMPRSGVFVMNSQPDGQELGAMTVKEFCEKYRIGTTKFYEEVKAGRLRAVKSGTRTLVLNRDSRAWEDGLPAINFAHRAHPNTGLV